MATTQRPVWLTDWLEQVDDVGGYHELRVPYEPGPPVWKEYLESLDAWDVFVRVLWVVWGVTALIATFWLLPGPWDWLWFLLP